MARARLLKPGFFKNPDLGTMPPLARLLFAGLWTIADREGRLKDEPLVIKGELFPYENCDVDDLLSQLAKKRFIVRYRAQTNRYISIANFLKHQTPHIREADSQIPPPAQKPDASTRQAPDKHSASTAFSGTSPAVTGNRYTEAVAVAVPRSPEGEEEKQPGYDPASFEAVYAKHYAELNSGKFLSPIVRTECNRLEREFGREVCIDIAADYGWEKHPNYLREVLSDPKRNNRSQREPEGESNAGPLDALPAGVRAEIIRSGALKPVVVDLD